MSQNEKSARFQRIGESDDVMMQEADQSQGNGYFLDIQTDDERRIKRPKSEMERIMDSVKMFGFKETSRMLNQPGGFRGVNERTDRVPPGNAQEQALGGSDPYAPPTTYPGSRPAPAGGAPGVHGVRARARARCAGGRGGLRHSG